MISLECYRPQVIGDALAEKSSLTYYSCGIWGFDYAFANYDFRKAAICKVKQMSCKRGKQQYDILKFQVFFEFTVGEMIVKSQYKL